MVILERVEKAEAGFSRSLTENVDTTTSSGCAIVKERTNAGLKEARNQGRIGGRKLKITPAQSQEIIEAITIGRKTEAEKARLFNVD